MVPYRFVFVIEQGLGHTVHGMNMESVLQTESDIDATILRIRPDDTPGVTPLPLTKNWSVQSSWAARCVLYNKLKERRADAIFIHTQVAALFATSLMRQVPTVISLDATPLDFDTVAASYGHRKRSAVVEQAKLQITRRALAAAKMVVTWSDWTARSVVTDYRVPVDRVRSIFPGVQMKGFQPADRSKRSGPVRVLFVGGDFARKGGDDLVQAVSSLPGLVELDVVTTQPPNGITRNQAIRVHTAVRPNSDRIRELYANADIFALPTRGDCTPLVIAEAMATGLPIVATTVGSIPDMVRDGENGLLVPPSSPLDLAAALRSLAINPSLRNRMAVSNRILAERDHDSERNWREIFLIMKHASRTTERRTGCR